MANLVITAANVEPYDGAGVEMDIAGETITQGMPVYKSNAGQIMKASNATQAQSRCLGISLSSAARKQPVVWQRSGPMDVGAVLSVGTIYVVANTAGGIHSADNADVSGEYTSADWPCILGVAVEADRLMLAIKAFDEPLA